MSPEQRERMIVDGAIDFFAANGFASDTRALAEHLGVSQSLVFHYFPTKEALIDKIYDEVFLARWKVEWEAMLSDRASGLRERLKRFYRDYYATADRYEWIRISLYSALRDIDINSRYHRRVRERIIRRIVRELREELGCASPKARVRQQEEQLVYNLHAAVIYHLIRKHIYKMPLPGDTGPMIEAHVDQFMNSAPESFRQVLRQRPRAGSRARRRI